MSDGTPVSGVDVTRGYDQYSHTACRHYYSPPVIL